MPLKRQALLIESSRLSDQPDLPGARLDIQNWKAFLLSDAGGAWEPSEIVEVSHPTLLEVKARLCLAHEMDYVFISFSGHGYHQSNSDIDDSVLCLTDKDEIPVQEVNPGNPRCTFVIDACRQYPVQEMLLEHFSVNEMIKTAALADRKAYRDVFDAAVQRGERGIIRLYSCDIEESAGESARSGGYYTTALIRCCKDWHDDAENGHRYYFSTYRAHQCAAPHVATRAPQQRPQYEGGRRNGHFPMAVKP